MPPEPITIFTVGTLLFDDKLTSGGSGRPRRRAAISGDQQARMYTLVWNPCNVGAVFAIYKAHASASASSFQAEDLTDRHYVNTLDG